MSTNDEVVSFQEAAVLLGMTPAVLRRRLNSEAFGWKDEREAAGISNDTVGLPELIRADAWRHFEASGAKPDGRTKYYLNNQHFDLRPFVIILREDRSVFCVDRGSVLESLPSPGMYAVYDPTQLLTRVGVQWLE